MQTRRMLRVVNWWWPHQHQMEVEHAFLSQHGFPIPPLSDDESWMAADRIADALTFPPSACTLPSEQLLPQLLQLQCPLPASVVLTHRPA